MLLTQNKNQGPKIDDIKNKNKLLKKKNRIYDLKIN